MAITSDPQDARLSRTKESGMQEAYLVLSEEERAAGYVRPVRKRYVHTYMLDGSRVPVVLTTEDRLNIGGCGALTTMATAIAQTFATNPSYYSATYCTGCRAHFPVGEFHWDDGSWDAVGS